MGRLPGAGGDGMLVGPNHPLFQREREQYDPLRIPGTGGQGNRGPWGGDGFLPPLGAPPGARFDPVGPFAPGNAGGQPRRNWGDEMPPPVRLLRANCQSVQPDLLTLHCRGSTTRAVLGGRAHLIHTHSIQEEVDLEYVKYRMHRRFRLMHNCRVVSDRAEVWVDPEGLAICLCSRIVDWQYL